MDQRRKIGESAPAGSGRERNRSRAYCGTEEEAADEEEGDKEESYEEDGYEDESYEEEGSEEEGYEEEDARAPRISLSASAASSRPS
jgi:hypothetical protein